MDNVLSSGEYKAFFDTIQMRYAPNNEKMVSIMGTALEIIADKIMLGKFEAKLISPASQFNNAQNIHMKFYKSEMGYEDDPYIRRFDTGEKGKVIVTAYPVKGYHWNPEEIEAVDLIVETIFVFAGRSRLMELAERANTTDVLTGIYNHTAVVAYMKQLSAKKCFSDYTAFFINLKNFGYVNKRATSRCGDLCLKKYAHKLKHFVGDSGIVGRLGGDNFVCVILNDRVDEFIKFTRKITVHCEMPDKTHRFDIESRLGVAKIKEEYTPGDVMGYIGVAIDHAKSGKKDICYFNDDMYKGVIHAKEISAVFADAIANREFTVYYQPKVSLNDYTLCGSEALVRWIRGGRIVSPMEFIPVLEREGKICDLDFYVFESVCRDIREWLDLGIEPVKISSNFSKLHLHNKELANDIFAIMDKYNVDGKYIQVELTEMSRYEDDDAFAEFINILKTRGVSTAIDDFGTGYSSMNMLRNVNVDVIKLDKSFFEEDAQGSGKYEIMVRNVVNMINELGMNVIAEGVENKEQVEFLKQIKCSMVQGFYFDKPMPHDQFEDRLRTRTYCQE